MCHEPIVGLQSLVFCFILSFCRSGSGGARKPPFLPENCSILAFGRGVGASNWSSNSVRDPPYGDAPAAEFRHGGRAAIPSGIESYEAMHAIRKGQIGWVANGDPVSQRQFINSIFGVGE